jgi:deoxycytidylate deaminase
MWGVEKGEGRSVLHTCVTSSHSLQNTIVQLALFPPNGLNKTVITSKHCPLNNCCSYIIDAKGREGVEGTVKNSSI